MQAATTTTTIQAQGMSCQKCVGRVKVAVGAEAGVRDVSVDLATQRVTVQTDGPADADALAAAVRRAGYGVVGPAGTRG